MAEADTAKSRVRRVLFPQKRRRNKPVISEKWYRENPMTMNSKLRQAIMDALPFDTDKKQADLILRTIFDYIVERVISDESITIEGFGRFFLKYYDKRYSVYKRKRLPGVYRVRFTPSRVWRNTFLRDEE